MFYDVFVFLVIILTLLILSGLVSASEVSLFSLPSETLERFSKSKIRTHKLIAKILEHPQRLLITILISNNFINVGIALLSTLSALRLSYAININPEYAVSISIILVTVLVLLFSEIIPKLISSQNPEKVALVVSPLINFFSIILYPIVELFLIITNSFKKRIPISKADLLIEEIKPLIELGGRYGVIRKEEEEIIKNLLQFPNKTVKDVMTSRVDMVAIELNTELKQIIKTIKESGFSRLPVYQEQIDNIVGILYAKDIIQFIRNKTARKKFDIKKFLKEPIFVPETMKLETLLQEFKQKKMHIAIVVDEFGGTAGLVTLQDIITEIFGEIEREEAEEKTFEKINDDEFLVDAGITIEEVNELLGINLKTTKSDYDTIGGFILDITGKIPKEKDVINYENLRFTIEKVENRRIKKIRVEKLKSQEDV
ncbi:hemolysin family protein [Candidatus Kryptobacter tengchongensis]|uniref:hemolysin family protein n=1 Tax=Kryptobacter tengchongensis TaxID=1643429 RepID=UPI000707B6B0|nr:hemolysin family protein [Candidatus Kryptobacter tengchongensis]CUS77453.1 putative hemolysin [Candidatus Kryptobacter tengchongensis]